MNDEQPSVGTWRGLAAVRKSLKIDPSVKAGDFLTSISILITCISLMIAWSRERQARAAERADKVRRAAAMMLAKLERSQELALWYYEEIQPLFVETSELLSKDGEVVEPRDFLWRRLDEVRTRAVNRLHEEQIEQAYVELYGYYPGAYRILTRAIAEMRATDERLYRRFKDETQSDVFSFAKPGSSRRTDDYQSAMLGNKLRQTTANIRGTLKDETGRILRAPHDFILSIILASDDDILMKAAERMTTPAVAGK
jgi:hypothetical protein